MYAEEYRARMIADHGVAGFELIELRECITERLEVPEDFTREDLARALDILINREAKLIAIDKILEIS